MKKVLPITGGTTSEQQILAFIVEGMVEHYLEHGCRNYQII